ncbi:MAG: HAD family phosphatase [Granulosicoccaceae bacterium]
MHKPTIKALLFDLGGVVLEVNFHHVFKSWAAMSVLDEHEIKARFKMDQHYQQHEKGQIEAPVFFEHLRHSLQITASDDEMAKAWNDIFGNEMTASLDAIDTVRNKFPTYGFSNTNRTHQIYWEHHYPRIPKTFDKLFVSSEIGLRKPDPDAFNFILKEIAIKPEELLFFEDSLENIEGAERLGIQTVLVSNADSVVKALNNL